MCRPAWKELIGLRRTGLNQLPNGRHPNLPFQKGDWCSGREAAERVSAYDGRPPKRYTDCLCDPVDISRLRWRFTDLFGVADQRTVLQYSIG